MQLGTQVSAVLLGNSMESTVRDLFAYGADQVYLVDRPELEYYNDESYARIFLQLVNEYRPDIILFGATAYGRSLAPRIASALNTGLTADCTGLEIDPAEKVLLQTRPAFGGNLMATIVCRRHRPQMATVRPMVMKAPAPDYSRRGKVIRPKVIVPPDLKVELVDLLISQSETADLAEADVVVAAGRGMAGPGNLKLVEELAGLLGGRSAHHAPSWTPDGSVTVIRSDRRRDHSPQSIYRLQGFPAPSAPGGMSSAEMVVAINKDPAAPILKRPITVWSVIVSKSSRL